MKVAIVHDWLYGGGAELVVEELHHMFPDAPIYTSFATDEWRQRLNNKVVTGYLNKWPFNHLRKFLPILRQHWFRNLDLGEFDLIISSSGNGEAKFAQAGPNATHICYCHTPTHFYWRKYEQYYNNPGFHPAWLVRLGMKLLVKQLRRRDYEAAQKVDYFIANSAHIQADIKTYYNRESVVVHPPVDIDRFASIPASPSKKASFIMWGRHVPYKRFDIAIEACSQLGLPLTIIGQGPDTDRLKHLAGPTITFTGWLKPGEFEKHISESSAFIFPPEEDFGIAPLEALAAGLPLIAYKAGGALDYVVPGRTGVFFEEQTTESLVTVLKSFDPTKYSSHDIKSFAQSFSRQNFVKHLQSELDRVLK